MKAHLLYIPYINMHFIGALLGAWPEEQNRKSNKLYQTYQQYTLLWDVFAHTVSSFAERYKPNKIFINDFSPYTFKENIRREIELQTHLGKCLDTMLQDDTTIELLENPNWWDFEDMLIAESKQLSSQLFVYLRKYLDWHKKNSARAGFLTDFENNVNLYSEKSLVDEWQFPVLGKSGKQEFIAKQVVSTPSLGENTLADIRGEFSAKQLAKSIKEGDSCVAFLYAGDTPISNFRALLPEIKLHHRQRLNKKLAKFMQQFVDVPFQLFPEAGLDAVKGF